METGRNVEQKETWTSSTHFLMSCIAMSVGLGNVWRFPFTAYENGGGVFLIPYVIVLALAGRPVYYLEACLGQFSGKSNVAMFNVLAPALKGMNKTPLSYLPISFFFSYCRIGLRTSICFFMCFHLLFFGYGY